MTRDTSYLCDCERVMDVTPSYIGAMSPRGDCQICQQSCQSFRAWVRGVMEAQTAPTRLVRVRVFTNLICL